MSKTITEKPPNGNYDCEKARAFPFLSCMGPNMKVGRPLGAVHDCGVIFDDVNLPNGIEIVSARLYFRFYSLSAGGFPGFKSTLYGWDASRNNLIWSPAENMSNVPVTIAHIDWNAFFSLPADGAYTKMFDVKPIIEELMDRPDWKGHLDLGFPLRDNGSGLNGFVGLLTFESGGAFMPRLEMEIKPRVILTTMSSYEVPVY